MTACESGGGLAGAGRAPRASRHPSDAPTIRCAWRAPCYHLGNRHVALQVGAGWVRYQHDHVLDDMVRGLGLAVTPASARFEPERGAYAAMAMWPPAATPTRPAARTPLARPRARRARASCRRGPWAPRMSTIASRATTCSAAPPAAREPRASGRRLRLLAGARVGRRRGLGPRRSGSFAAWLGRPAAAHARARRPPDPRPPATPRPHAADDDTLVRWSRRAARAARNPRARRRGLRSRPGARAPAARSRRRRRGAAGWSATTCPSPPADRARRGGLGACRSTPTLHAYAWGWLENQVLAGVKLVPLGQIAGQRLLLDARGAHPGSVRRRARARRRRHRRLAPDRRAREQPARNPIHAACSAPDGNQEPSRSREDHDRFCASASADPSAPARPRSWTRSASACATRFEIAVVTNDIYTREDAEFLIRSAALAPERIVGVETGGCPHTAIREDASMNLAAIDDLCRRFPSLDLCSSRAAATTSPRPSARSSPTSPST